jgi:hypothetical protein
MRTVAGIGAALAAALTIGTGTAQATPYGDGVYEGQTAIVSYANSVGWRLPLSRAEAHSIGGEGLISLCADLFTQRYPAGSGRFPFDRYPGFAADG